MQDTDTNSSAKSTVSFLKALVNAFSQKFLHTRPAAVVSHSYAESIISVRG